MQHYHDSFQQHLEETQGQCYIQCKQSGKGNYWDFRYVKSKYGFIYKYYDDKTKNNLKQRLIDNGVWNDGKYLTMNYKVLPNNFFISCKNTIIELPTSLTHIGHGCFERCDKLKELIIPSNVEYIGEYCFDECTSLTNISLSSKIRMLEENTFNNCKSLKEIYIPSGITRIEKECFKGCDSLIKITIPNTLKFDNKYIGLNSNRRIEEYDTKKQFISDNIFRVPNLESLLTTELQNNNNGEFEIFIKLNKDYEIDSKNNNRIKPRTNKVFTEIFEFEERIELYNVINDIYYINVVELDTLNKYTKKIILNQANLVIDEL